MTELDDDSSEARTRESRRFETDRRRLLLGASLLPVAASGCERGGDDGGAPGPVKRWLRSATAQPFAIPDGYLGIHSDHGSNKKTPAPTYRYDAARTIDADNNHEMPATHWATIEREPGRFFWDDADRWFDGHRDKQVIWTLIACPKFYQRYPNEPWAYPYLPGGGSPPQDPEAAARFVAALCDRYRGRLHFLEIWNEPSFASKGVDPLRHRWTPEFGLPAYFTGTAADLAQTARAIRKVLPDSVKAMGVAWEGQSDPGNRFNGVIRFSDAPDGKGGKGRDHLDVLSVHSYTYDGNPNKMIDELMGYEASFQKAGYPSEMPRYLTECGAEKPKFWTTDYPSMDEKIRHIRRWCMIPAAFGYRGIYLYKQGLVRTLGDPGRSPRLAEEISRVHEELHGRVIERAAELRDGTIWLRFKGGGSMSA